MTSGGSRRVLVTGATGALGPALVRRLAQEGYWLRTFTRRAPRPDAVPPRTEVVVGDIRDRAAVRAAVTGCEVVYHLAAKLHVNFPSDALRREYEAVNVHGTAHVLEAAEAAGARRVVVFSTIAVYGPTAGGVPVDESAPLAPVGMYGETKAVAERQAMAACGSDGEPLCTVLRPAAIYGPGVKGNYQRLVHALERNRFIPVGSGSNRRTLVHEDDVAAAAVLASQHAAAAGRCFNITDGAVHTFTDIVAAICAALGRRPPRWHLPAAPMTLAAGAVDGCLRLAGREPKLTPLLRKMAEDVAVSGERIRSELGFQPYYDLESGWRRTLAEAAR